MPNNLCSDNSSCTLVAKDGLSEARTTTIHDLPPYSVQTALVLAAWHVQRMYKCSSQELQKLLPNHLCPYQDILHGWLPFGSGMSPMQKHFVTEPRCCFTWLRVVGKKVPDEAKMAWEGRRAYWWLVPMRTPMPIDHVFLRTGGSSYYQWMSNNVHTIELEPERSRTSFLSDQIAESQAN